MATACTTSRTAVFAIFLVLLSGLSYGQQSNAAPVPVRLTLENALEIALARNPTLLRERQNVSVSRANLLEAGLRPNPDFELSSESYPVFESAPGPFFNQQELVLRAGQTIETAGKRSKRVGVARQDLAVTQSSLQDAIRQIKLEVKTRYYTVVLAKAQHDLAQQIMDEYDRVIRVGEARYKQGESSGFEFNRLQTERLRFFNDLVEAELQLKNAKAALLEILGARQPFVEVDVTEPLGHVSVAGSLQDLQQEAEQNRPDLIAQRQRIERQNQDVTLQKAIGIPNVTPAFGYKRDFGLNTVAFGVSIPVPLFNRNQAGVGRARAQLEQQRYEFDRVQLAVRKEVEQAYNSVQAQSRRVVAIQDLYVPSARRVRDIAQTSFQLGALDLVGFLDAQRSYRETLRGYNQALFEERAALFSLEAAVGKEF